VFVGGGELLQTVKVVHAFCFLSFFFFSQSSWLLSRDIWNYCLKCFFNNFLFINILKKIKFFYFLYYYFKIIIKH